MSESQVISKSCEICNNEYLEDSRYCPTCGSKNEKYSYSVKIGEIKEDIKRSEYYELLSSEEISHLEMNPHKDVKEKLCPNCGFKNTADSQFCEECGAKITDSEEKIKTPVINVCQNCGTIAQEGDKFCPECGNKL